MNVMNKWRKVGTQRYCVMSCDRKDGVHVGASSWCVIYGPDADASGVTLIYADAAVDSE